MSHFQRWMSAAFGGPVSFDDTVDIDRVPTKGKHPNPLSLRWLAEQLEALAEDPAIPLRPEAREKAVTRIAAARRHVNADPASAAWALRQAFNHIQHTTGG